LQKKKQYARIKQMKEKSKTKEGKSMKVKIAESLVAVHTQCACSVLNI